MKSVVSLLFLFVSLKVQAASADRDELLSSITPNPKPLGSFTARVSMDTNTGTDRLDLTNSKGEVVCSFRTSQEKGEALQSIDVVKMKSHPDRLFIIQGEEGASGSDVVIVMDVGAKPGKCVAKVLEYSAIQYFLSEDRLVFKEQYEMEPGYPSQMKSTCQINKENVFTCTDDKGRSAKASH